MSRVGFFPETEKVVAKTELRGIRSAIQALYQLIEPDLIVADSASYRNQTDAFFSGPLTPEKVNFLVHGGFPQICALSYFFEENYLGRKQVVVTRDRVMRTHTEWSLYSLIGHHDAPGLFGEMRHVGTFKIVSRHVTYFPVVVYSDGDVGAFCWPTQAPGLIAQTLPQKDGVVKISYVSDPNHLCQDIHAVNVFSKLDEHPIVIDKSYQTFLKIVLIPNSVIFDTLKKYLSGETLSFVFQKVCRKKGLLQNTLKTVKKFSDWYSVQPCTLAFKNKQTVESAKDFFCQFAAEKMKTCLLCLSALLAITTPDIISSACTVSAVNLYTPFIGLRSVLLELSQDFFQRDDQSPLSVAVFIAQLKQLVTGFYQLNFFVDATQNEKLHELYQQLQAIIFQLTRDFDFTNHQLFVALDAHTTTLQEAAVLVHTVTSEMLAQECLSWIQRVDPISLDLQNKKTIVSILQATERHYEESQAGLFKRASSVLASAGSLLSSSSRFFLGAPSRHFVSQTATPPSSLKVFIDQIVHAQDALQLMEALRALLSCKTVDVVLFSQTFAHNVVSQFLAELAAREIVHEIKNNADVAVKFAERLSFLSKLYCYEEIEKLFVQSMQPCASAVCAEVDEWVDCSFAGESVLSTQARKISTEPVMLAEPMTATLPNSKNAADLLVMFTKSSSTESLDFADLKPCYPGAAV